MKKLPANISNKKTAKIYIYQSVSPQRVEHKNNMKIKKSWFKVEIEITPEEFEKFYLSVTPEIASRTVWAVVRIIEKLV